jgi:hypothetical protein
MTPTVTAGPGRLIVGKRWPTLANAKRKAGEINYSYSFDAFAMMAGRLEL